MLLGPPPLLSVSQTSKATSNWFDPEIVRSKSAVKVLSSLTGAMKFFGPTPGSHGLYPKITSG